MNDTQAGVIRDALDRQTAAIRDLTDLLRSLIQPQVHYDAAVGSPAVPPTYTPPVLIFGRPPEWQCGCGTWNPIGALCCHACTRYPGTDEKVKRP